MVKRQLAAILECGILLFDISLQLYRSNFCLC